MSRPPVGVNLTPAGDMSSIVDNFDEDCDTCSSLWSGTLLTAVYEYVL